MMRGGRPGYTSRLFSSKAFPGGVEHETMSATTLFLYFRLGTQPVFVRVAVFFLAFFVEFVGTNSDQF